MIRSRDLAEWIRQQVSLAGAQGVIIALTGTLESAVAARLCQRAVPGRVVGAIASCHGDSHDAEDAESIADLLELPVVRLDLAPAYDRLVGDLEAARLQLESDRTAEADAASETAGMRPAANLRPRLRMSALFFIAESLNCLVAGTATRGDVTLGAFARYGDDAVDLLPLGQLLESDLRGLARELEIPEAISERPRTPGVQQGAFEQAQVGFSYADLERYLTNGPDGVSPALAMRIERVLRNSETRRPAALIPDL